MAESKITKIREFILGYPNINGFSESEINWDDADSGYGIIPVSENIVGHTEDITGDAILYKQYNVLLYSSVFTTNDVVRLETTGWIEKFTEWIETQSVMGTAPTLGDNPDTEHITAQNGMSFELSDDGQSGRYQIQIQCFYEKHYKNYKGE